MRPLSRRSLFALPLAVPAAAVAASLPAAPVPAAKLAPLKVAIDDAVVRRLIADWEKGLLRANQMRAFLNYDPLPSRGLAPQPEPEGA